MWEEFDLGPFLQLGENKIQALASSGTGGAACFWAEGCIAYEGEGGRDLASGPDWRVAPAMGAKCRTDDDHAEIWVAGSQAPIASDWRAAQAVSSGEPRCWAPVLASEQEAWPLAVSAYGEVEANGPLAFVDMPSPFNQSKCVHKEGVLRPGKVQTKVQVRVEGRAVYLVLDFGRLVSGFPRVRMRGLAGAMVEMGFSRTGVRVEGQARYLSADGPQEWTSLKLRTCRYLLLRFSQCPEEIEVDGVGMLERQIGVAACSRFAAAPPWDRVWSMGRDSLASGRQEIYPARTSSGEVDWMQGYAWSLNDFYLSGDTTTAGALLASVDAGRLATAGPLQGFAYCLLLEAYYQYSGDKVGASGGIETALDFLAALDPQRQSDGLLSAKEDVLALNAFYGGALAATARLCREMKRGQQAQELKKERNKLRNALAVFWSVEQGLFASSQEETVAAQWANGLILFFSLETLRQRTSIVSALEILTPASASNLLEAFFVAGGLWRAGEGTRALIFMDRHWGKLVDQGTKSWIPVASPNPMPWAGPEYFLGAQVLGIRPRLSGYRSLTVWPQESGLSQAKGQIRTCRGQVHIDWRRLSNTGGFEIQLELDQPLETHLWVPRLGRRFPTVRLNGETVWRNEKVHLNPYVRAVACRHERLGLVVESAGVYRVEVE